LKLHQKLLNELEEAMFTPGLADLERMPQYGRQFLFMIPTTYARRKNKNTKSQYANCPLNNHFS